MIQIIRDADNNQILEILLLIFSKVQIPPTTLRNLI
jgi:hypothetical protein